MDSSISSSEARPHALRWCVTLLAIIAVLLAGAEAFCRFMLPELVAVEQRRDQEYVAAASNGTSAAGHPECIVLGNSLLGEGVDFQSASASLETRLTIKRLMVEDTSYLDWYYGIEKLLKDGAHPDLIALVLSPDQIVSKRIRGDYSAYLLMTTSGAFRVGGVLGFTNTERADLVLSSGSALLGMRTNLRKSAIGSLVPGLKTLMQVLTRRDEPVLDVERSTKIAAARLRDLDRLTNRYGVGIVLVIPPTGDRNFAEATDAIVRGAQETGVPVIVPVAPGELGAEFFSDGFHLNERGRAVFTEKFAAALGRTADRITSAQANSRQSVRR